MAKNKHALYPGEGLLRDKMAHSITSVIGKLALIGFGVVVASAMIFGSKYYYDKRAYQSNRHLFAAYDILDPVQVDQNNETLQFDFKLLNQELLQLSPSVQVAAFVPLVLARSGVVQGNCSNPSKSIETIENYKKFLSLDHPSASVVIQVKGELAKCLSSSGRIDEAKKYYEETLDPKASYAKDIDYAKAEISFEFAQLHFLQKRTTDVFQKMVSLPGDKAQKSFYIDLARYYLEIVS